MTKQDALKKIEELKAYVEGLDKQWPPFDLGRIRMGNAFRTSEEAEQHALRLESMGKRDWIPEVGEKYWVWSNTRQRPFEINWENDYGDHLYYYHGIFKTKEECQEWGEKYADAWKIPNSK